MSKGVGHIRVGCRAKGGVGHIAEQRESGIEELVTEQRVSRTGGREKRVRGVSCRSE